MAANSRNTRATSDDFKADRWKRYQFPPAFVLAFHGCDREVGEAILSGRKTHLKFSRNDYDWLGSGIYFWEANPQRALEFAYKRAKGAKVSKGKIRRPFVVGAVLNLGLCLDLRDSSALREVERSHDALEAVFAAAGKGLPQNDPRLKVRKLDCAVFNFLHEIREGDNTASDKTGSEKLAPYDSIRGIYREGKPLYKDTDICQDDHIQICIRNPDCILGYFRPIPKNQAVQRRKLTPLQLKRRVRQSKTIPFRRRLRP